MKTQNTVQLIGYLGNDPAIKTAVNGKTFARLQVATDYFKKHKDETIVKKTTWHYVQVWGWLAEKVPGNFIKGSHILVQGEIYKHNYKDKEGQFQQLCIINAKQLLNLDR
jgi:single-strand DNA-binding protein